MRAPAHGLGRPWALALGLALLVVGSTGHRFANDFVFDDEHLIRDGGVIHDPSRLPEVWTHHTMYASAADPGRVQSVDTYRPLTLTLFFLDAQLSGHEPWAYHATNLLLHLGCVWLTFVVAIRLLGRSARWASFYGAAVFAVHPWAVEAHVWINGRSDPLALLLGLGGFWLLLGAEVHGARAAARRVLAAALVLLGLLSKETLLTVLPAMALAPSPAGTDLAWAARLRGRVPPLAGAALAYLGARSWVLSGLAMHRDAAMLAEAAYRLPALMVEGIRHALAPPLPYLRSLRDEYANLAPWQVALFVAILTAAAALAFWGRRRWPVASWSALWFFPPLVPVAIITTVLWPGFGRYLYLPLCGLAFALAAVAQRVRARVERPRWLVAAGASHVAVLAVLAALFTRDFRHSDALYGAAMRARPDAAMPHGWSGLSLRDAGEHRAAARELLRAAELDPSTHRYLVHAGRALLQSGDRAGAARVAARGIRRFHGRPEEASYRLLAVNAMSERDPSRAVAHLDRCLEVWPGRTECRRALERLLHDADDAEAHRRAAERRMRRRPDRAEVLRALLER
ncbi:MAG TPA: hypothetical protein RMH99_24715 [Sandaracinaceae bacterium LLY-WYZ-13_1]|nr:hypothetical protein [Sandaracinaceae bacterium LLY-WYZ-13_1]